MWLTLALWMSAAIATAYLVYPALCRRTATKAEARAAIAGDDLVPVPTTAYTLALTIGARPVAVWRELARIDPAHQSLVPGDRLWLTSSPQPRDRHHHVLVVSAVAGHNLVLLQSVPGERAVSWAFVLREHDRGTRLVFRRRAIGSRSADLMSMPALYARDLGMLKAVKRRAERTHSLRLVRDVAA